MLNGTQRLRNYMTKKAIKINGKIVGWKLYKRGMFGWPHFIGYEWIKGVNNK